MLTNDLAIVFDCGATNVRVIAIDTRGNIIASKSYANHSDPDPEWEGGRIWDIDKLWEKLCDASKYVLAKINKSRIAGITVTSFGVDGTIVNRKGEALYPIISWQCNRTEPIMNAIDKYIPIDQLYGISGVYPYAFNTINKFIWFKENKPELLDTAHKFLFFPSLLIQKLTGVMINDTTMAGTSMMTESISRSFSEDICELLGITPKLFGKLAKAGDQAGKTLPSAEKACSIPTGTPVFFAGHDTQFAIFGSGAKINEPVLSSGTWEILMTRTQQASFTKTEFDQLLTTELDALDGLYNIGQNWLGSGILEWFSKNFYPNLHGDDLYNTMIGEAEELESENHGLFIDPSFYVNTGEAKGGAISGLTIHTKRQEIYLALLESLTCRLREGLEALQKAGDFKAEKIICVGGGAQNKLWNQLRANICGIPIQVIDKKETTVLGASSFVFKGAGNFASVQEARDNILYNSKMVFPDENKTHYEAVYANYSKFKKTRTF